MHLEKNIEKNRVQSHHCKYKARLNIKNKLKMNFKARNFQIKT